MKFVAIFFGTLLLPFQARAQYAMSVADGFDAGLTLPWLFPEQTIALVAAGLFLGQRRNLSLLKVWPILLIAMGIGLAIPPTTLSLLSLSLTLLSMAFVLAVLIAVQLPIPAIAAIAVAVLSGLLEGTASAPGASDWSAAIGVAAGSALRANLLFIAPYLFADWLSGTERRPWALIALRVAGSWVAAISIMMLALLMRPLS